MDAGLLQVTSNRTRGNGLLLHHQRFRLSIRKNIFTGRVVRYRNKMPRKMVELPSLKVLNIYIYAYICGTPGHGLVVVIVLG